MPSVSDDFKKLIAVVSPRYCDPSVDKNKMRDLFEKEGFSEGVKKMAKPKPLVSFKLVYDAPSSQLEPVYFWVLDFLQEAGVSVEKIADNFTSSPGSGHFGEIGQRVTRMQEEGMKVLGAVNQVTKSVLNLLYDMKEFEIRLDQYKDANGLNGKQKVEPGMLSLKQIWLDNVDMKRGRGSINQLTYEMGFSTLRELFMVANSVKDVENMAKDEKSGGSGIINEQVKRTLIPRIDEFLKWKDYSEKELQKRFEIEKAYLKSQVETLKLYSNWARPYLKAAENLRMKGFERDPALVNVFNTAMFDIVLLGKKAFKFADAVMSKKLPPSFIDFKPKRDYFSIYLISFIFRGIPQKVTQQSYGFGGRLEMYFDAYSLNSQELELIKSQWDKNGFESTLKTIQELNDESLKQLTGDIDHFLKGDEEKKKKEEKKKEDDINPFSALLEVLHVKKEAKKDDKSKKDKKELKLGDIKKDSFEEEYVRKLSGDDAQRFLYATYDVYKKSHGHASTTEAAYNEPKD